MGFNDDMNHYLRSRKKQSAFEFVSRKRNSGPSWWDRMWTPQPKQIEDDLMPDEQAKLENMERDISRGEARIERAATPAQEERFAEEQEERVGFYHKLRNLFKKEEKLEDAYDEIEHSEQNVVMAQDVTEDFRALATIQMRWLERMPTRVKDEFKTSDDYGKYVEILQRRGVARKK